MLIQQAEVEGKLCDIRLVHGRIAKIAPQLPIKENEMIYKAQGMALFPSLHDHHIHLNATAASLSSISCGYPHVKNKEQLVNALNNNNNSEWIRAVGYHPSIAGKIDRKWLDKYAPKCPIRIQHRSGRLWIFNSLAIKLLGNTIPPDGILVDGDQQLQSLLPYDPPNLTPLISQLLSYGITGVTEATIRNTPKDFDHICQNTLPLKLVVMGQQNLSEAQNTHNAEIGSVKLHYHEHHLPDLKNLTQEINTAHESGRSIAAHCVTLAELMLTLAAIEEAGIHHGDRIEHAAFATNEAIEWIARLGICVVTQPHFITERYQAYLQEVEKKNHRYLWRLKGFIDAGIPLALGSDAPFGQVNPWIIMASAVKRPIGFGENTEIISPEEALQLYTKPYHAAQNIACRIQEGAIADLCLIDKSWNKARKNLAQIKNNATWINGVLVYDRIQSIKPHSKARLAEIRRLDKTI